MSVNESQSSPVLYPTFQQAIAAQGLNLPPITRVPRWIEKFRVPPGTLFPDLPKAEEIPLITSEKDLFKAAFRYARAASILQIFSIIFITAVDLGMIIAAGKLIDATVQWGLTPPLIAPLLIFAGLLLLDNVATGLLQLVEVKTSADPFCNMMMQVSSRAVQNGAAIGKHLSSGEIIQTCIEDFVALARFPWAAVSAAANLVVFLGVGAYMLQLSLPLGLVVIVGLPLSMLILSLLGKPLQKAIEGVREVRGDLAGAANDAVLGLRILRGLGGHEEFARHYYGLSGAVRKTMEKTAPATAAMATISVVVPGILNALLLGLGASLIFAGEMTAGTLVTFFGIAARMAPTLKNFEFAVQAYSWARVGAQRLLKLLQIPLEQHPGTIPDPHLNFSAAVLTDGESGLRLEPGKITGIVCKEPAKSAAILRRLAGLETDPSALIGGHKIAELPLHTRRRNILYAEGSAGIFAGSLRRTLLGRRVPPPAAMEIEETLAWEIQDRLGDAENADVSDGITRAYDQELQAALADALCQDVLTSHKAGLDLKLEENGRNLSGGQRQRIALARAYAQQAPVLLLIEPTSALDANTENQIGSNLLRRRHGQTTAVATTSPLLLNRSDEVVFLHEDGRVSARGTHRELLAKNPEYKAVIERDADGSERKITA